MGFHNTPEDCNPGYCRGLDEMRGMWLGLVVFILALPGVVFASGGTGPHSTSSPLDLSSPQLSGLLICARGLKASLAKGGQQIILVDVRPRGEFERVRLPGSLHMELYSVKTKGFLKGKDVVIIANGYRLAVVLRECMRLKDAGFKSIRALYGGIQAWIECDGKLEGTGAGSPAQYTFNEPLLLFEERDMADWVVLDLFGEKEKIQRLFPEWKVVSIPYTKDPDRLKKRVEHAISKIKHARGDYRRYLVFLKGRDIKRVFAGIKVNRPIFIYKGSVSNYESFLKQEARILEAKKEMERKRKKKGLRKPCGCGL